MFYLLSNEHRPDFLNLHIESLVFQFLILLPEYTYRTPYVWYFAARCLYCTSVLFAIQVFIQRNHGMPTVLSLSIG